MFPLSSDRQAESIDHFCKGYFEGHCLGRGTEAMQLVRAMEVIGCRPGSKKYIQVPTFWLFFPMDTLALLARESNFAQFCPTISGSPSYECVFSSSSRVVRGRERVICVCVCWPPNATEGVLDWALWTEHFYTGLQGGMIYCGMTKKLRWWLHSEPQQC